MDTILWDLQQRHAAEVAKYGGGQQTTIFGRAAAEIERLRAENALLHGFEVREKLTGRVVFVTCNGNLRDTLLPEYDLVPVERKCSSCDGTQEVGWNAEEASPCPDCTQPPDGYAYLRHSPTGNGTYIAFDGGGIVNGGAPIEAIPYWLGHLPNQGECKVGRKP